MTDYVFTCDDQLITFFENMFLSWMTCKGVNGTVSAATRLVRKWQISWLIVNRNYFYLFLRFKAGCL